MNSWQAAWTVFVKELKDALRDRRTLMAVFVSSIAMGPLMLVVLSSLVGKFEKRAEAREVVAIGIEAAPTLRNYLERQTFTIKPAAADWEARLKDSKLGDPVLIVPADFEDQLAHGQAPRLELVYSSANQRAEGGVSAVERLLRGFDQEQVQLRLLARGVAPGALAVTRVDEHDIADTAARAAQMTGMVPIFVLMAVLYGSLNAALDTTAGERERGSLEPLLMNPAERWALVAGKWGAVVCVSVLIAVLSCFSFLPGQWVLRSDTLQAMFQYGPREAVLFILLLLPLAAALSAVLMAVAIRSRTFKEAQASSTVVVLAVSLLPLVNVFDLGGEAPWHLWTPALAQNTLMTRVLKGEALDAWQVLIPLGVCAALAAASVWSVARQLDQAAVK